MKLNNQLEKLINETDLQVTDEQKELLVKYVELLDKWNRVYNLTSIRNPSDMLVKHIMDSLMVGSVLKGENFIDVGTGPGLPGIPLAILYPEKNFVLLDSLGKRITFLRQVVYLLKLENVTPVQERVEKYEGEKPFDGILSRAFSSLNDMVTWCQHLITSEEGRFIALKGQYPQDEIEALPENITFVESHEIKVPQLDAERHVIVLKKN
jgi:16S rRNA (guanine527-N7)-methyltransferase